MSELNSKATVDLLINGQQAQQTLNQLRQNALQLETAIAKAAATGNKADLKRLRRELTDTKRQIREIESATQQVEHVLRNLDRATPKELNQSLVTLNRQLNYMERGSEAWNAHVEKIKAVKRELKAVNEQLRDGEGFWERFNRKMNDWQTTIAAGAAAVTGLVMAGRSAVSAYADMDAEMANVRKFTGMTAEEVEALNEELKKIDTRTSRVELNQLAEEAGKLGKTSQEDVLGFVRAANQINVALDELGDGATLTLSKLTNIFGDEKRLGTEKALLSVGSVINELSQNCTASAPYLANFAQRMAGVGAQARMTIPEIMGLAAVLDSQGQKVEMSSTAVSKVIMDMFKQQDQIIKATGLNAKEFKETVTRDTNEGLLMLLEQLHSLGDIDVLAPVFKDMGENGARAAQVISALAGNLDMVRWEQEEARKAFAESTSVTKEFAVQNNTIQAGLDKARKHINELAVELGEKLMPVMRHIMSSTTMLLKFLSTMVDFIIKHKVAIVTVTASIVAYVAAVKLQYLWSLRYVAVQKLKAAWMAIEDTWLAASILKHKVLKGEITAAAAAQTFFNKVLKMNPYGVALAALTALVGMMVKFTSRANEAAKAQKRLQDAEEEVKKSTAEEIMRIEILRKTIEDSNVSIDNRRKAIEELQSIVPDYHASLTEEGRLIGHNAEILDIYVKQLKNSSMIQHAVAQLTEVELRYKKFSDETPDNIMNAYMNEKIMGMKEGDAMREAAVSPSGYRAWKAQLASIEAEKAQWEGIINSRTAENQQLADQVRALNAQSGNGGGSGGGNGNSGNGGNTPPPEPKHEERFKEEKEWRDKELALNRISHATGQRDYEDYQLRMLDIEEEYNERLLRRSDLTEQERLEAQAAVYESRQKQQEEFDKLAVEEENAHYAELVAIEQQRYIDGEVALDVYNEAIARLELEHLRRMVQLYKEGTKERLDAETAYRQKLVADQQKRQRETEAAEKKHQDALAKMKEQYFGDNPAERKAKYDADYALLVEVYNREIAVAGNNAKEKLRIEEAFQKAKLALQEKYNIDGKEQNKNFLQSWNEDVMEFLESDLGQAISGSIETFSNSMSAIFQQLTTIVQAELEIQTAAIEKKYEREISLAEGNNYKVKRLEKQKQAEIAKAKNEANKKMFAMQVIQAVAQTATNAINAYGSAAAIPLVGYILAPVAAGMAVAAGMLQVAAIKKQQQASEAQGYATGGFTPDGRVDEVAGVVHAGEWVASQRLVKDKRTRPILEALDYAQRTNSIGSLSAEDVSSTITAPMVLAQNSNLDRQQPRQVVVQNVPDTSSSDNTMREVATVIANLKDRLDEPFLTVNSVTGETGMKQAQDEYEKLIRNKTPKSRR